MSDERDRAQTPNNHHPFNLQTGQPIEREQPGYYPGFRTLDQQNYWDAATREVICKRVQEIPSFRFFKPDEVRLMNVLCGHLLPQDDRTPDRRIPIVPFIDQRLHEGKTPGYRFASMPPDPDAYRLGFQAIQQIAQRNYDRDFLELTWREQEDLLKSIHDAKPMPGAEEIWERMPVHRYWALILQDSVEVYCAHPWVWDEMGFGGPAYPRAYTRLERGEPEPWEVEEQRYEWTVNPEVWVSDPKEREIAAHSEYPIGGQGGSH